MDKTVCVSVKLTKNDTYPVMLQTVVGDVPLSSAEVVALYTQLRAAMVDYADRKASAYQLTELDVTDAVWSQVAFPATEKKNFDYTVTFP